MKKQSVRFALETNEVHDIPNLDDLTEEEIEKTWFTSRDYRIMNVEVRAALYGMKRSSSNKPCTRGLEARSPDACHARRMLTLDVVYAVLEEQEYQQHGADSSLERIAAVSREITRESVKQAYERGLSDAIEASKLDKPVSLYSTSFSFGKCEALVSTLPRKIASRRRWARFFQPLALARGNRKSRSLFV